MSRRARAALAGLLLGAATGADLPAAAQPTLLTSLSAEAMQTLMAGWGWPATLTALEDGTPVIDSRTGALAFSVLFYNCADDAAESQAACRDIQFRAAFASTEPPDLSTINDWNRERRFVRAYLHAERYAYLEMDLRLDGGLTDATISAGVTTFTDLMTDFARHIGG